MRLGSAHFGSNAPVSWGSETAYDLAPLPSGAGTVPRSKHRGLPALVSRAETLLKTPSTWFESLSGKAEPGTASPGLLQNVFAWDQFPRARQSRCSLKMLVRSRANAPRFLGAFLRTESGGRSGFDPVDLSSKPLDSFDPVVDLGETSAGRDRNPSGPGRLSVRNPPQAAVARPPWPGRRGQAVASCQRFIARRVRCVPIGCGLPTRYNCRQIYYVPGKSLRRRRRGGGPCPRRPHCGPVHDQRQLSPAGNGRYRPSAGLPRHRRRRLLERRQWQPDRAAHRANRQPQPAARHQQPIHCRRTFQQLLGSSRFPRGVANRALSGFAGR